MGVPEHMLCSEADLRRVMREHLEPAQLDEVCRRILADREIWAYASGVITTFDESRRRIDLAFALVGTPMKADLLLGLSALGITKLV